MEHNCGSCLASPLEAEDDHDHCGACLGVDHLREALTDEACMNCCIMPRSVRLARLAQLDPLVSLPSFHPVTAHSAETPVQKRSGTQCRANVPVKRREAVARDELSFKVDCLAADMEQIKELLMNIQLAGVVPSPAVNLNLLAGICGLLHSSDYPGSIGASAA